jgi:8-oxo-dGTP pyrophosphatase MutT (NUDIX family)
MGRMTQDRRFHVVARRAVAANRRFEVLFDRLESPAGDVAQDYLILRPKVLHDGVSGVCVLPEADGRIGLMRVWRHHFEEEIWQAPAGFAEPGETVAETARRELREEVGLDCADADLVSLGLMIPDAGIIQAKVALYVARNAFPVAGATGPEEPGLGTLSFFSPAALQALAAGGAMGAATMIACCRYLTTLNHQEDR